MADSSRWVGPDGVPRRTSPLTLAAAAVQVVLGLAWMAVLLAAETATGTASTSTESTDSPVFLVLAGLVLAGSGVYRSVGWWSTTYSVLPTELVVDQGVLSRDHRVLPFARVQQADTHQSLVGQVLGLTELRIDSAGVSGATQVKLGLLDSGSANALRDYVLYRRAELHAQEEARHAPSGLGVPPVGPGAAAAGLGWPDAQVSGAPVSFVPVEVPVLRLGSGRLAMAALTHTSLLVAVPLVLVVALWSAAFVAASDTDTSGALGFLAGAPIVVLIAAGIALIQMVQYVIGFYGFAVSVVGDEIHLRYGLLETRNLTLPRRRVQQITIADNPVRRLAGLVDVSMHTAAAPGGEKQATTRFQVPILRRADVDTFVTQVMGDHSWAVPPLVPRGSKARRRAVVRRALVILLLVSVPAVLLFPAGLALLALALLGIPWGTAAHRRAGHGVSGTVVAVSHGVLHHRVDLVPLSRVQSCRTDATPMQRLNDLATFRVDIAGARQSPYLYDMEDATASALARAVPRYSKPVVA